MHIEFLPSVLVIMSVATVAFAWRCLPTGPLRLTFIVGFLLMAAYKLYDPSTDARGVLWARHVPVYLGELVFFAFIVTFSKRYIEVEQADQKLSTTVLRQNMLAVMPVALVGSGISWYQLVTDQGLPHILTLPLFVILVSLARLRFAVYQSTYLRIISIFTYGIGAWILIHVSEFVVESQKLIEGLDEYMAYIEFFWFAVGTAIFCYGLKTFKDITHAKKA